MEKIISSDEEDLNLCLAESPPDRGCTAASGVKATPPKDLAGPSTSHQPPHSNRSPIPDVASTSGAFPPCDSIASADTVPTTTNSCPITATATTALCSVPCIQQATSIIESAAYSGSNNAAPQMHLYLPTKCDFTAQSFENGTPFPGSTNRNGLGGNHAQTSTTTITQPVLNNQDLSDNLSDEMDVFAELFLSDSLRCLPDPEQPMQALVDWSLQDISESMASYSGTTKRLRMDTDPPSANVGCSLPLMKQSLANASETMLMGASSGFAEPLVNSPGQWPNTPATQSDGIANMLSELKPMKTIRQEESCAPSGRLQQHVHPVYGGGQPHKYSYAERGNWQSSSRHYNLPFGYRHTVLDRQQQNHTTENGLMRAAVAQPIEELLSADERDIHRLLNRLDEPVDGQSRPLRNNVRHNATPSRFAPYNNGRSQIGPLVSAYQSVRATPTLYQSFATLPAHSSRRAHNVPQYASAYPVVSCCAQQCCQDRYERRAAVAHPRVRRSAVSSRAYWDELIDDPFDATRRRRTRRRKAPPPPLWLPDVAALESDCRSFVQTFVSTELLTPAAAPVNPIQGGGNPPVLQSPSQNPQAKAAEGKQNRPIAPPPSPIAGSRSTRLNQQAANTSREEQRLASAADGSTVETSSSTSVASAAVDEGVWCPSSDSDCSPCADWWCNL